MKPQRLMLVAATAGLVWFTAPAATAAPEASIDHVEVSDAGKVRMLLGLSELPSGNAPDLESIAVSVSDAPVEALAEPASAANIERTTILALDTSQSMDKGGRFEEAKEAAESFLAAAPEDVRIGLVTFDSDVQVEVEPTTDHGAVSSAIESLDLALQTRLYDGVAESVAAAGEDGARSVLLLSDGADVSDTPIEDAIAAVEDAGVRVDAVALQQSDQNQALLRQITDAAGGTVIPAGDPEALTALFTAEADALSQQILVQFDKPADVGDEASLTVSVDAGGTTYTDSAFVSLAAAADKGPRGPEVVTTAAPLVGERELLIGGAALAVGLAGLLSFAIVGAKPRQTAAMRQMDHYSLNPQKQSGKKPQQTAFSPAVKESALAMADSLVKRGDFEAKLSQKLSAAGMSFTASEWLLLQAGLAVGTAFVGFVLGGVGAMLLLLVGAVLVPWLFLTFKRSRRVSAFNGQLAETLQLMGGGLSAGLSLPQAIDTVVREGAEPMAGEMRRALIEQRLGVDIEDALDGLADRMTSEDFRWVVMAIRIQREVGGNLAELLNTVAATLREREYLRRQVKVLSAEGRLSAWIIGGLPVVFCIYLVFTNPDYLVPMYTEVIGLIMSGAAVALLGIGAFVLSKMVKVEV